MKSPVIDLAPSSAMIREAAKVQRKALPMLADHPTSSRNYAVNSQLGRRPLSRYV